jgi:hypothetical protein
MAMGRAEPQGGLAGVRMGRAGAGLDMPWQGCGHGRGGRVVDSGLDMRAGAMGQIRPSLAKRPPGETGSPGIHRYH